MEKKRKEATPLRGGGVQEGWNGGDGIGRGTGLRASK